MLGRKSCSNDVPQILTLSANLLSKKGYGLVLPDNSTITEIIFTRKSDAGNFIIVFWPPENAQKRVYEITANKSYNINLKIPNGGVVTAQCEYEGEITIFYTID